MGISTKNLKKVRRFYLSCQGNWQMILKKKTLKNNPSNIWIILYAARSYDINVF